MHGWIHISILWKIICHVMIDYIFPVGTPKNLFMKDIELNDVMEEGYKEDEIASLRMFYQICNFDFSNLRWMVLHLPLHGFVSACFYNNFVLHVLDL